MRRVVPLPLIVALLVGGAARAEEMVWRTYRSEEGRFAVSLPATPARDSGSDPSEAGPVDLESWTVEVGNLVLRVEHHDLPRLGVWLLTEHRILALAGERLLADRHGRKLSEEPWSHGDHPGLVLRYARSDLGDALEEARLVLAGRRLFIALARSTDPGEIAPVRLARFFDSFTVWEARDVGAR